MATAIIGSVISFVGQRIQAKAAKKTAKRAQQKEQLRLDIAQRREQNKLIRQAQLKREEARNIAQSQGAGALGTSAIAGVTGSISSGVAAAQGNVLTANLAGREGADRSGSGPFTTLGGGQLLNFGTVASVGSDPVTV